MSIAIHIITIGKWKRAAEKQLFHEYCGRCSASVRLHELQGAPKIMNVAERKTRETEMLFSQAKEAQAEAVFVLDESGQNYDSVIFAHKLQQLSDDGVRRMAFLIGGDVGMDKAVFAKSGVHFFSFGQMTWPHLLVRVLLAEQIYRAQTINSNHPYHRA